MSDHVREMFNSIAPTYDRINTVLSLGAHHLWRRAAVRLSEVKAGDYVLDCATGTGELALALKRRVGSNGRVVGTDFSPKMIAIGASKALAAGQDVSFQLADVLSLPFPDASFHAATIAFGIRNVDDPSRALREMARVVRQGGTVTALEFGQPRGVVFGPLYRWYSRSVLPTAGGLLSGNRAAYRYLPRTAAQFPSGDRFEALMRETGVFSEVLTRKLWGGIAFVYVGKVS